jgi:hypothetical protein
MCCPNFQCENLENRCNLLTTGKVIDQFSGLQN